MPCATLSYQSKVKKRNGESYNHSLTPPIQRPNQGTRGKKKPRGRANQETPSTELGPSGHSTYSLQAVTKHKHAPQSSPQAGPTPPQQGHHHTPVRTQMATRRLLSAGRNPNTRTRAPPQHPRLASQARACTHPTAGTSGCWATVTGPTSPPGRTDKGPQVMYEEGCRNAVVTRHRRAGTRRGTLWTSTGCVFCKRRRQAQRPAQRGV